MKDLFEDMLYMGFCEPQLQLVSITTQNYLDQLSELVIQGQELDEKSILTKFEEKPANFIIVNFLNSLN